MRRYVYIEKVSLLKMIIGNLFLISGIFGLILKNNSNQPIFILAWIFFVFVGIFFISTEGIEIHFEKTCYRKILSMFGINYGLSWINYSKIKYILLLETKVEQTFGGRTFSSTATASIAEKTVKINLFYENNKSITIYYANNLKEALIIANKIKEVYNIEINIL